MRRWRKTLKIDGGLTTSQATLDVFNYGFLTRIDIKRVDGKTYTFKESDYPRLSLNDIEDMFLLKVQGKLHHFPRETEFDMANSLLVYIRSLVIKKKVKDVQLGVESYQQKLNLTEPKYQDKGTSKIPSYTMKTLLGQKGS
ncbi:hypothetical protein Tco_0710799 [Tanacetum coccineum]